MRLSCTYCEHRMCECGGRRKRTPKKGVLGEQKIVCGKCGGVWHHWHVRVNRNKVRGVAREPRA